jgi:two-component system response regulator AtoC
MGTSVSRVLEAAPENGFIFGVSEAVQALNATVGEIAGTDIPVLIQGDSGTGKEVYARLIHRLSGERSRPLAKLSCTVLEPGQLLDGAKRVFRESDETGEDSCALFLDGVDELSLECQRALLSTLQEHESEENGRARVRLISTVTRNLDRDVQTNRFRRELYFRLAGVCLRLPTLRERKEDIRGLMEYFLEKHAAEMGRKMPRLSDDDTELLLSYEWPGNIRELANLAKKIAALGETRTTIEEMRRPPMMQRGRATNAPVSQSLKAAARTASRVAERELILKALERTHWNRKQAAKDLQISYKALLYKIKQMDVGGDKFGEMRGEE